MAQDLANAFAELWGILATEMPALASKKLSPAEATKLYRDASAFLRATPLDCPGLQKWANTPERRLIAAHVIDDWFEQIAQCGGNFEPLDDERAHTAGRYLVEHCFNSNVELGKVILRRPWWGRWANAGQDVIQLSEIAKEFEHLLLIPAKIKSTHPDDKDVAAETGLSFAMSPIADVRTFDIAAPWKVGFAPIAQARDDIEFVRRSEDGAEWYDTQTKAFADRVNEVVETLCKQGCRIVVFPEMVLHPDSLAALKEAVAKFGPASDLALVLAGSSRVENGANMPFNECAILDHNGEQILTQRKLSRWNLEKSQCGRFEFDAPGKGQLKEYISVGETLAILERKGLGRLAVLICEDLSRSEPGKWVRDHLLIDFQFTPVLDANLKIDGWEAKHGGEASLLGGCRVVVANSIPLTHRQNDANQKAKRSDSVVTSCGIGLAVDGLGGEKRHAIVQVDLSESGNIYKVLEWRPSKWKALPRSK